MSDAVVLTTLGRVLRGLKDGTHGTFSRVADGYPLLSAKNVRNGWLSLSDTESQISASDFHEIVRNGYPKPGDVLLTIVGTIGRAAVFREQGPAAFQRSVCFLRPGPLLDVDFLAYQLQGNHFQEQLELRAKVSAQPGVYLSDISQCRVYLPEVPTQVSIVDFLDRETGKIDAFIRDQEELIGLLRERRAATISHALSPPTRTDDEPQAWSVVQARYVIGSVRSGVSVNAADWPAEPGEVGVLKTSSVYSGNFDPMENKTVDPAEIPRVACPVREGSIIVSRMNTPQLVGAAGFVSEPVPNLYLPDRLWQIQVTCNPRYFHYWTLTSSYRSQVKAAVVGTSSSMQNLSQSDFSKFSFPLPSANLQADIVSRLDCETRDLDLAIQDARIAVALSQELRAALISAAVTGKIDVREHMGRAA